MKNTVVAALLAAWVGLGSAQAAQPASTVTSGGQANPDYVQAAESFVNSAVEMTVCAGDRTVARAGRLVALTAFADALVPGDGRAGRLLADIYYAQADPNAEMQALESCLKSQPEDYYMRLRWLEARQTQMQNARQRSEFLESIVARKDLDDVARGYVAAALANLYLGQGLTAKAATTADRAVRFDPLGRVPLGVWERTHEPNDPAEQLSLDLRILRAAPREYDAAWRIGERLAAVGLHDRAVAFFHHVWVAKGVEKNTLAASAAMTAQYASALLDANQADRAVAVLVPATRIYVQNASLQSLLIEAYRQTEKPGLAEQLISTMARRYKVRASSGVTKPSFSAELGWFYATTQPNPSLAFVYAGRAINADPKNQVYQRIMGAAELIGEGEKAKQGRERLEVLLGKDIYASVLLAGAYQVAGETEKLKKAVLAAAPLAANGPAWRNLRVVAARSGITLPAPTGREKALAMVKDFPGDCLKLIAKPNECIAITLAPAGDADGSLVCGDAIEIDATIKNVSAAAMCLDDVGAMRPRLALTAKVQDAAGQLLAETARLPLVVWPAPRVLKPGQTVTCRVRLDVCELKDAIARRPLETLTITLTGLADPDANGKSRLAGLKIPPLTLTRRSLLGPVRNDTPEGWQLAYRLALGRIVYDYRRGKLPDRVRAARQIASMLAFSADVQKNRKPAPGRLTKADVDRLVILAMLKAILKDRSPAVRAEAAHALTLVRPDETVIGLLAPLIQDPSATVRCRLVETLVVTNSKGHDTIVDLMRNDRHPLVRQMANALRSR